MLVSHKIFSSLISTIVKTNILSNLFINKAVTINYELPLMKAKQCIKSSQLYPRLVCNLSLKYYRFKKNYSIDTA